MTGTGVAASRYIITSRSQIKASVREQIARGNVVARIRSTGPITVTTQPAWTEVPLKGATWLQAPEEVNELVGLLEFSAPRRAECSVGTFNFSAGLTVQ